MKQAFLLSIITDEISQDPEKALELVQEFGFDGVELRSVWNCPVEELSQEQLRGLSERLKKLDIKVSAIASSLFKDDWKHFNPDKLDRLIRACRVLECERIRGFSFWKSPDYSNEAFAELLTQLDSQLSNEGITLVLENDPSVNLATGFDLARFFREYRFQNIGVLWDPGNDIYTTGISTYPKAYEALRGSVKHVHVKDAVRRNGEPVGVAPGDGWMDFEGQFRDLHRDGYQGWLVLEPHFRLEGTIDEALLKCPGGAAFSEGGYLPSRLAMENLRSILQKVYGGM